MTRIYLAMEQELLVIGTTRSVLAASSGAAGRFYAANNHGIFRSSVRTASWQRLNIAGPEPYRRQCVQAHIVEERW